MLKRLHCQMDAILGISPVDPILIKSGYASVSGSQMPFVTTVRKGSEEVYIPGSSLKGVIRSQAEKICRTLKGNSVCLPYQDSGEEMFCGYRFRNFDDSNKNGKKITNEEAYRYSCPACRTFGSTYFIGRAGFGDAYADPPPRPETRDGVAINRHTGGAVPGAKFDYEVVTYGTFRAVLSLRNFEFWQFALLAYILRDFEDEVIRIGTGKSRGLGRVKGTVENLTLTYYDDTAQLRDLKDFCNKEEKTAYGLADFTPAPMPLPQAKNCGLRKVYDMTPNWPKLGEVVSPALSAYLAPLDWPGNFQAFLEGD